MRRGEANEPIAARVKKEPPAHMKARKVSNGGEGRN